MTVSHKKKNKNDAAQTKMYLKDFPSSPMGKKHLLQATSAYEQDFYVWFLGFF